jgi:hypothetical protein
MTDFPCCEPKTDETTSFVIPEEVVEAAAKAYWESDESIGMFRPTSRWSELIEIDPFKAEAYRGASRAFLAAALPHLRPLVEAQELRLATEVALKLGREEMREEIAKAFEERWINTGHLVAAVTAARIARETGARP